MIKYKSLYISGKEFKLRINTQTGIALERKLGYNPVNLLVEANDGRIPALENLLLIFHASLQMFHHGVTMEKTYEIFDAYVDEDHDITDFLLVVMDILSVSGYIKADMLDEYKAPEVKPEPKEEPVIEEVVQEVAHRVVEKGIFEDL